MLKTKKTILIILLFAITIFLCGFTAGTMAFSKTEYITEYVYVEPEPVSEVKTEPALKNLGTFKLTAYCPCARCCGKCDGITASGEKAVEGVTVAADTNILPFGTKIIIDGLGEYTVQDRGGAIKGNKIDIYFSSHTEALQFGVQTADVYVKQN